MSKKTQLLRLAVPLLTLLVVAGATFIGMPSSARADSIPQGPLFITSKLPGNRVVDILYANARDNQPTLAFTNNGGDNQRWTFEPVGTDGYGYFHSVLNPSLVLNVVPTNGYITVSTQNGSDHQLWTFDSGYLKSKVVAQTSDGSIGPAVLAVASDNVNAQLWIQKQLDPTHLEQQWTISPA